MTPILWGQAVVYRLFTVQEMIQHLSPIFNQHSHWKTYIHRTYTETIDYFRKSSRKNFRAYVLSSRRKGTWKLTILEGIYVSHRQYWDRLFDLFLNILFHWFYHWTILDDHPVWIIFFYFMPISSAELTYFDGAGITSANKWPKSFLSSR